jgi:hypothetical protein
MNNTQELAGETGLLPFIDSTNTSIDVWAVSVPFSTAKTHFRFPEGLTVGEMIFIIQPDEVLRTYGHVFLDDEYVPVEMWASVYPKSGQLVTIRLLLGKGGGGKNPLSTILSIAILAVSAPISAGILGALGVAAGSTTGLIAGALIKGAISAVGNLLVSAIAPPSKPKLNSLSGAGSSPSESPTMYIEGARNQVLKWGVVPVVLGTHRMVPPQCALPYTETSNNEQYVRQLFCLGYGQELVIAEEKIGETNISNFDGYEKQTILNGNSTAALNLYANTVFQEDLSIQLTYAGGFQTRTSQDNANELIIDLTWPTGLSVINDNGKRKTLESQITYRYGVAGSGSWTTVVENISASTQTSLRKQIRITGLNGTTAYDVEFKKSNVDIDSDRYFEDVYWTALRTVTYENPVRMNGLNLVALRMKATDQLNGPVDQYNLIVSNKIPDYDSAASPPAWSSAITSNPASIFRYVLQGLPNARGLADSRIDLETIEYWHGVCVASGFEFNTIVDYETTVREVLLDVCAAGRASPTIVDGKWSVVIDEEKTIPVQHFTPRNS